MNVRLKHNMNFFAGVYFDGKIIMNHYTLVLHMITNTLDPVEHNVAFERIKYFVYNQLDSTIFINRHDHEKCKEFLGAKISITTMPGEPVDQLIGLMLFYKLNAIMENRILVEETEISSILGENMIYLHNENEHTNIESMPNYWIIADPIHNDFFDNETDKIVTMHAETAWRELDLIWPIPHTPTNNGNVVVFKNSKS